MIVRFALAPGQMDVEPVIEAVGRSNTVISTSADELQPFDSFSTAEYVDVSVGLTVIPDAVSPLLQFTTAALFPLLTIGA